MYKVLFVFDNHDLLEEMQSLHIWGDSSEFEIADIVYDGQAAYRKMKKKHYDLVITEIRLTGIDGLQLLRNAKRERLCSHIVLCSEFADFNYARQGIILGAFDYFVKPFDVGQFISMFTRIKNETFEDEASGLYYTEEIISLFEKRSDDIHDYIADMMDKIYSEESDLIKADKLARQVCQSVFEELFEKNAWLELYVAQQDFYSFDGIDESNQESYKNRYKKILLDLFSEYCELYPYVNNEKIKEVILYILNNPENNLKQKNIASELYINSSYLSTVFLSQTGIRFVDYLNTVKLKRAAWLLKETDMKIVDIATRLDYKDLGYFSRLFKAKYNITPSGYRLPDEYDYQI